MELDAARNLPSPLPSLFFLLRKIRGAFCFSYAQEAISPFSPLPEQGGNVVLKERAYFSLRFPDRVGRGGGARRVPFFFSFSPLLFFLLSKREKVEYI